MLHEDDQMDFDLKLLCCAAVHHRTCARAQKTLRLIDRGTLKHIEHCGRNCRQIPQPFITRQNARTL